MGSSKSSRRMGRLGVVLPLAGMLSCGDVEELLGSWLEEQGASGGATPTPARGASPGCFAGGAPGVAQVEVPGEYIFDFPTTYDGRTPLPVVFAFHANANPNTQLRDATRGTTLESDFVMVFPKSVGAGWNHELDAPRFDAIYAGLARDYCIDESRVFAVGHSSGAQFIEGLLCAGEDRFRGVAPSASAAVCERWDAVPTLLIHGQNDTERGAGSSDADGRTDLAGFLASAACADVGSPYAVAACSRGEVPVDPGCVSYQGCSEPLIWCQHDDPNYGATNHGWPCFASQAIADFFVSLL